MLSLLLSCTCESASSSHVSYVGFAARLLRVCAFEHSALDIIALSALILHLVAGVLMHLPQFRLNWQLRSAANHSVLCLSFLLSSEVCFLVASLLERWSWLWQGFRIWRVMMATLLLAQVVWYKHFARNEFALAVEAPFGRAGQQVTGEEDAEGFLHHEVIGEYEEAASAFGWPTRGGRVSQGPASTHGIGVNSGSVPNKANSYNMGAAPQWGEALLGQPVPVRAFHDPFAAPGRAHSPAKSRLPSSQQYLLAHDAPRTISPNLSPKITTTRTIVAPGASSHAQPSAPSFDLLSGHPSEQRIHVAQAPTVHHGRSISPRGSGILSGSLSPSSSGFTTSPSSAFRPVLSADSVGAANFSAVQTTTTQHTGYSVLASASTNADGSGSSSSGAHGAPPTNLGKFTTIGLTLMCLTLIAVGAHGVSTYGSSDSLTSPNPSAAGRALLSFDSSSLTAPCPFGYDPVYCNLPYDARGGVSYALRVFSWLGAVFACLALFPQFIYNDSYMKSTAGLSFASYTLVMISNVAFILGTTIPEHNDWFNNRYSGNAEADFYRDQVVLPLVIAFGFTFLQLWVLVVQRAKYSPRRKN